MAGGSRGRDITLTLATDLDRFDPDRAADGMEDLGQAADRAARDLADVDDAADQAARAMSDVGDGAADAGHDVDGAMEGMKDAGRGAAQEIGGSFDGSMDGIVGGVQGAAAEFGASMGGMVGAAALAGAAIAGVVWSKISAASEAAQERVGGLRDRIRDLGDAGNLDTSSLKDFLDALTSDDLNALAADADTLGLSIQTLAKARYGDADALAAVTDAQRDHNDATEGYSSAGARLNRFLEDKLGLDKDIELGGVTVIDVVQDQSVATRLLADETRAATDAEKARTAALGGLSQAQIDLNDALKDSMGQIADASDDVESAAATSTDSVIAAAQAQADATATMADTWADYAGNSAAAADEIIAEQERQIAALTAFQQNTQAVLEKGGEDLVAWANAQTDAPAAMAAAAKMTPGQAAEIGSNYRTAVELAGAEMIKGTETALSGTDKPAKSAGEKAADAYAAGFAARMKTKQKFMSGAAAVPATGNPWIDNTSKRVP